MRRYDDSVEVRRGLVDGVEGPEQFVWRDRLWVVCAVVAHWMETGTWWEQPAVQVLLGTDTAAPDRSDPASDLLNDLPGDLPGDLLGEREVWRVEAARGAAGQRGVFDLSFDWAQGRWRLVCALD